MPLLICVCTETSQEGFWSSYVSLVLFGCGFTGQLVIHVGGCWAHSACNVSLGGFTPVFHSRDIKVCVLNMWRSLISGGGLRNLLTHYVVHFIEYFVECYQVLNYNLTYKSNKHTHTHTHTQSQSFMSQIPQLPCAQHVFNSTRDKWEKGGTFPLEQREKFISILILQRFYVEYWLELFHLWCCRLAFTEEGAVASLPTRKERATPPFLPRKTDTHKNSNKWNG